MCMARLYLLSQLNNARIPLSHTTDGEAAVWQGHPPQDIPCNIQSHFNPCSCRTIFCNFSIFPVFLVLKKGNVLN